MKTQNAIDRMVNFGKIVEDSYNTIMMRNLKDDANGQGPLLNGLASYMGLNMKGEFIELDEAYNVVRAYIGEEVIARLRHQDLALPSYAEVASRLDHHDYTFKENSK